MTAGKDRPYFAPACLIDSVSAAPMAWPLSFEPLLEP